MRGPTRFQSLGEAHDMRSFRNVHVGANALVCGCGESLNLLSSAEGCITIGVNDVGRRLTPDYLVIVNPRSQFSAERLASIEGTHARAVFSHLNDLRLQHAPLVRFRLGRYGGTGACASADALDYTQNSPYVAICLAMHMGATRIGLIGVDFTDAHFFAKTGRHALTGKLSQINAEYGALAAAARARGVELLNVSPVSRLTAVPSERLEEFIARTCSSQSLNIVSYSTTPVAGVPEILARCISARTPHRATCVWATRDYGNGVRFDGGISWRESPELATARIAEADVIIVHNGHVDPSHRGLIETKPVVTMAHNYAWNVDRRFVERGFPGVVVGQYQATLPEFAAWNVVPNPVPYWEPQFSPEEKGAAVRICFTPSGAHERYPAGHKLFWHAKGARTTRGILDEMARRYGCAIESTGAGQVPHATSLAMKRRSHLVIDECVTGSYHRNSLEGLAAGCVVVNGVGLLPGVTDALRQCAPGMQGLPFVFADLESLHGVLAELVESGPERLAERGRESRQWLEQNWRFESQWQQHWSPLLDRALEHSSRSRCKKQTAAGSRVPRLEIVRHGERRKGVSIVIPHSGSERLMHLGASLKNLAQIAGVAEIIVVEMGDSPAARELVGAHGARYVWTRTPEPFERGRALNIGSGVALYERVLWKDNDLLLPRSFLETAESEMTTRKLDNLLPYAAIAYLGREDSSAVMAGRCNVDECAPEKVLTGGRDVCGGAALVCARFLERHGGIPEGFRGWGGEDNAWMHKAALLGRSGVTSRKEQKLFHLYHPDSGAQRGQPWDSNPHYCENVALLTRLRAARSAHDFARRFPNTGRQICPWNELELSLVHDGDDSSMARTVAAGLRELYGTEASVMGLADALSRQAPSALYGRDGVVALLGPESTRAILESAASTSFRSRIVVVTGTDAVTCPEKSSREVEGALAVDVAGARGERELAALIAPALSVAAGSAHQAAESRRLVTAMPVLSAPVEARTEPAKPVRNVFACLVHETQECVIDLVRNLQYHDFSSVLLLYNGGNDPHLLTRRFPFERHGAVLCPSPRPMRWGYLHLFALDCMRFALAHLPFDTLTIVDSDQLAIRSGYSAHIGTFLAGKRDVGMLGSARERQMRSTRIAPAAHAWREFELWRPLLRRFPRGEEQFVHWTFWPGTVFTRAGAEALVKLFEDEELQRIIERSQIWATEEVILPTLLAALGFGIESNPCSGDYVKHRQAFSARQLELALRRPDVFWIHPVARRYDDPLRVRIRRAANHYARKELEGAAMNTRPRSATAPLLLTLPILQKMRPVQGWLDDEEADVLIAATARALNELAESNAIVEIGSFCGRSTVVLASTIKALSRASRLYAIDPHDGKVGALDEGVRDCGPTLERLRSNLVTADVADVVEVIPKASWDVEWDRPVNLLFIDGLHDYANVSRDFYHFERWIVPGGYVAFHDYATYYPGVMSFVDELLRSPDFRLIQIQRSLALVQRVVSGA